MTSKKINNETIERLMRQGIPGFGEDFANRVLQRLDKISPLTDNPTPTQKPSDRAKLKYSVLAEFIKKPKPKLLMSMEIVVVRNREEIVEALLQEKLLTIDKKGTRIATPLGRRLLDEFEHGQKAKK